jgi:hypothetical protein
MELSIWYASWEYQCCGAEIRSKDIVEHSVYWHSPKPPAATAAPTRLSLVGDGEVEIVWRWSSQGQNADGVAMVLCWDTLSIGVVLNAGETPPPAGMVGGQGRLFFEHNVAEPIPKVRARVEAVFWHASRYRSSVPGPVLFQGYEAGRRLTSTKDAPRSRSGDFRLLVTV